MISPQNDEELGKMLHLTNSMVPLLLKARRGESLTDKEDTDLRNGFMQFSDMINLKKLLIFDGAIVAEFAKHPGPIRKMLHVNESVDKVLGSFELIVQKADDRFKDETIREMESGNKERIRKLMETFRGDAFEIIGRAFLREIVKGKWSNTVYTIKPYSDFDAYAYTEIPNEDYTEIHIGEVKANFEERDIQKFSNGISGLVREISKGEGIKSSTIKTAAVVSFRTLQHREKIMEEAKAEWESDTGTKLNLEFYDGQDILPRLKKAGNIGQKYLNSIRFAIQTLGDNERKDYSIWFKKKKTSQKMENIMH